MWSIGWRSNKLLLAAIALELVWLWALLNFEPVQKVFHTASIPLVDLLILAPFPILLLISNEFYKWRKRLRFGVR